MNEWKIQQFESLYMCPSRNGLSKPSRIRGTGYKMINMGELFANDRIYDIPMEYVPCTEKEKENAKIEKGDLLFARQSLIESGAGKCSIVMDASRLTVFESHLIRIRLNYKLANPLFYYYYFKSGLAPIKSIVTQGVQAGIKASDLAKLSVIVPPFDIQNRIASFLDTIDRKIETNNRINGNLLEQVQALYRYIFVESDHVLKQCRADEYFNITIGKTPPRKEPEWFSENRTDIKWFSISDMGKCGTFISDSSEYLKKEAVERFNVAVVPENTVLLSFKLTVGRIAITTCVSTTNEAIAHFKTNDASINPYLYCYLKDFKFDELGSTSSIATAVNSKIIKGMPFAIPERDELTKFNEFAIPAFAQIKANQSEIQKLSEMRDTLLPKLMSGELDVSEL